MADAADATAGAAMLTANAPAFVEHMNAPVAFTPFDVKWVPVSARFVVMGSTPRNQGIVQVHELGMGAGLSPRVVCEVTRPSGIKCGTFDAASLAERHLAVGDVQGALAVIDLERPDTPVFSAEHAHPKGINGIDGCGGGAPELATCGRDGCVRVWDVRVRDPVASLTPGDGQGARDAWTVAFGNSHNDDDRWLAAGYDNGDVKLYDLRAGKLLWEGNAGNGVTSVAFDRRDVPGNKLVAACLEGAFTTYDLRTRHPQEGFARRTHKAHRSTVWLVRHLPQNRDVFLTAGGNGGINLYHYRYPAKREETPPGGGAPRGVAGTCELLNARVVSSQPVVAWDWHREKEGLAVGAALDQTVRVYIVTKLAGL